MASGSSGLQPAMIAELCDWLLVLQAAIQRQTVQALQQETSERLASVAQESASDTIYEIDRGLDDLILEHCERLATRYSFRLVAEGLTRTFPAQAAAPADFCLVMDPLDGTRGLMYDKRSAWSLAAVAQDRGPATTLADIILAVQTEVPTTRQYLADTLWAARGEGVQALRRNVLTGESRPFVPRPSQATDLQHGFAMLSKFFPGRKAIVAEIEERLYSRLESLISDCRVRVFDDQYISTGGQLYELAVGHDRFNGDIRAALTHAAHLPGYPPGLSVHPYDICTELVAREAGIVVTDLAGGPLTDRLSEEGCVSWLAYANPYLQARIEPVLQELFAEYGLL